MKKAVAIILTFVLCLGFCIFASAESYSFENAKIKAEFDENYIVLTEQNFKQYRSLVTAIGHTDDSIKTYFQNNSVLLIAVSDGNKSQVQISTAETEFSKKIGSASILNSEQLEVIGEAFFKNGYFLANVNGTQYLYREVKKTDSVQFVAIENSTVYNILFYGIQKDECLEILSGIEIDHAKTTNVGSAYSVFYIIVIFICIIGLITAIVLVTFRLVRDIKKKETEQEIIEDIKIKRRKH